jgi:glucose-6-phosphate 1-dehydrogenase
LEPGIPRTLLILGATGDLTARLLLPGLGGLLAAGRGAGLSLIVMQPGARLGRSGRRHLPRI